MPEPSPSPEKVVFLHGWCGHGDEVESVRSAFPGPVLTVNWMPAAGSFDLEQWPSPGDRGPEEAASAMRAFADDVLERVRRTIVDAGLESSTIVGHSMGGAMASVLAADPALAVRRVVLLDASVPMPPDRREGTIERMTNWIDRAATSGRLATQAAWIAEASTWIPDFFHLDDQGPRRLEIERRFMFAPVVEAAMTIGGGMQWPITESVASLGCEVFGLAGDPARMPVDDLADIRPDAMIETCTGTGHYPHVFQPERTRSWLESGPFAGKA